MSVVQLVNDNDILKVNSNILCVNLECDTLDASSINVNDDIYINSQPYLPVGSISIYAGQTAPSGWLFCDGTAVSRFTYPRLFSVINRTYGAGDGTTTFNLPNLQERLPVGKSGSSVLGNTGGSDTITLSVNNIPSHTHTGTTDSNGSHTHTGTTTTNGSHTHSSNATGGLAQPGLAYSNGQDTTTGIDTDGSNELNLKTTAALAINSDGDHSHSLNVDTSGSHTHTFTTGSTGSGQAINVQNKFIVMNYIIRY
jgi:microcystin-dependent protein